MLLLFMAAIAAASSGPAQSPPLQTPADYPPEAVANGWEGDAVAELTVSPTGLVTACRIVKSSGHKVLDDATCDVLTKRARFTPARDKNGNPIEDHFITPTIRWRLGP